MYPNDYNTQPPDVLAAQGYRYADLFDALRRQRAHLSSVTVWGLADDGTWLSTFPITRLNEPLLFDEQLQAKPAYWGIVDRARLPAYAKGLIVPAGRPSPPAWSLVPASTPRSLQVNDATSGARKAARTWNDPTGLSYVNTSRRGVVRLL